MSIRTPDLPPAELAAVWRAHEREKAACEHYAAECVRRWKAGDDVSGMQAELEQHQAAKSDAAKALGIRPNATLRCVFYERDGVPIAYTLEELEEAVRGDA